MAARAFGKRHTFVKRASCAFDVDDEKYFPEDRQYTAFLFCSAAITWLVVRPDLGRRSSQCRLPEISNSCANSHGCTD
jgi:hypothetical protein